VVCGSPIARSTRAREWQETPCSWSNCRTPLEDLADYELIEDGKPYREWCVPADHQQSREPLPVRTALTGVTQREDEGAGIRERAQRQHRRDVNGLRKTQGPTHGSSTIAALRLLANRAPKQNSTKFEIPRKRSQWGLRTARYLAILFASFVLCSHQGE
jgi:hypothetical protein